MKAKETCFDPKADACEHGPGCDDIKLVFQALVFMADDLAAHERPDEPLRSAADFVLRIMRARAAGIELEEMR